MLCFCCVFVCLLGIFLVLFGFLGVFCFVFEFFGFGFLFCCCFVWVFNAFFYPRSKLGMLIGKSSPCGLSRYLNGPLPYVRHHITVNKMC